jgi:negative modulator of initiation of replication
MKTIQVDDELYKYIASQTQNIGESASEILRRLLLGDANAEIPTEEAVQEPEPVAAKKTETKKQKTVKAEKSNAKSVFDLLNKEEIMTQKGAVGRFLFILAALHRAHPEEFEKVLQVKGKGRVYFATTAEELEAHGSSIKPKQIPDSIYWVVTNNNTPRKKLITNEVAVVLGYDDTQAEKLREFI